MMKMGGQMTKKEWKDSCSALRRLIRDGLKEGGDRNTDRMCVYKFGLVYNQQYRFFHLWNGQTQNTIATIKLSGKNAYVRYREKSWYSGIIQNIVIPNRKMIFVKSNDLGRHKEFVVNRIGNRVERSMADFLAPRSPRMRHNGTDSPWNSGRNSINSLGIEGRTDSRTNTFILSVPLLETVDIAPAGSFGDSLENDVRTIHIHFSNEENGVISTDLANNAIRMVRELHEHGEYLDDNVTYGYLSDMHANWRYLQQAAEEQRERRSMRLQYAEYAQAMTMAPGTMFTTSVDYDQLVQGVEARAPRRISEDWYINEDSPF